MSEIRFNERAVVEAGWLLFVMDKKSYVARVNECRAAIPAREGSLKPAHIEVDRRTVLGQREAEAQAKLDEASAKQAQVKCALLGHQAEHEGAQLDLSFTDIKSPIAGRNGRANVSLGDLVGPGSPPSATVVR